MSPAAQKVERLAYRASRFVSNIAALILFVLMVLTCVDVIGRYVFGNPVVGAVELVRICMAGIIFFSMPAIFFRDEHIIVDLLPFFQHGITGKIVQVIIMVVSIVVTVIVADRIHGYAIRAWEDGDTTEYLAIPRYVVVAFITISTYIAAAAVAGRLMLLVSGRENRSSGSEFSQ
jgi:TRAP-type C4-dicarboxylate transport system permease small subunit